MTTRSRLALTSLTIVLIVGAHRCYSEQCPENKYDPNCIDFRQVATYDEIVDLPNHPEVLLIDVRRPDELAGTGTIPTSINIPRMYPYWRI